jgi:hypothetical protein
VILHKLYGSNYQYRLVDSSAANSIFWSDRFAWEAKAVVVGIAGDFNDRYFISVVCIYIGGRPDIQPAFWYDKAGAQYMLVPVWGGAITSWLDNRSFNLINVGNGKYRQLTCIYLQHKIHERG